MNTMERKIIQETIFREQDDHEPIPFGAIPFPLEPTDIINAGHDEGFYSENNSWDPHYYMEVIRPRLENDQEFEERKKDEARLQADLKKRRYETYLKFKKEFEPEA
jgi:hypothetical protein